MSDDGQTTPESASGDYFRLEYDRLAHAVQSGIAHLLELEQRARPIVVLPGADPPPPPQLAGASPKHLRVGVNLRASEHGALARLLIAKGIISEAEYCDAVLDGLRREVDALESQISRLTGRPVSLA